MKTTRSIGVLVAALLLSGCSYMYTNTQQDEAVDFSKFNTFQWNDGEIRVDRTGETVDRVIDQIAEKISDNMQPFVEEQLTQKGYTPVKEGNADFLVRYFAKGHVEKVRQSGIRSGSVGEGATDLQRSDVVVIGDLTVSMLDPGTLTVLWQGNIETIVKGGDKTTVRLKKAIARMFKDFPAK